MFLGLQITSCNPPDLNEVQQAEILESQVGPDANATGDEVDDPAPPGGGN